MVSYYNVFPSFSLDTRYIPFYSSEYLYFSTSNCCMYNFLTFVTEQAAPLLSHSHDSTVQGSRGDVNSAQASVPSMNLGGPMLPLSLQAQQVRYLYEYVFHFCFVFF